MDRNFFIKNQEKNLFLKSHPFTPVTLTIRKIVNILYLIQKNQENYMKLKFSFFIIIILLFCFCVTMPKDTEDWDELKYKRQAQYYSEHGHFEIAIKLYRQIMEKFPDSSNTPYLYEIGFNYYKSRKLDPAQRYFRQIISRFENDEWEQKEKEEKYLILSEIIIKKIEGSSKKVKA